MKRRQPKKDLLSLWSPLQSWEIKLQIKMRIKTPLQTDYKGEL